MQRPNPQLGTQGDVVGARIVAWLIDFVIVGVVSGILSSAIASISPRLTGLSALLATIVTFGYFIYLEGTYGQTLGKRVLNLVVVGEDGGPCTMTASAIRNVLRIVDSLPAVYLLGLIVMFVSDDRQRIGDIAADTIVVRTGA